MHLHAVHVLHAEVLAAVHGPDGDLVATRLQKARQGADMLLDPPDVRVERRRDQSHAETFHASSSPPVTKRDATMRSNLHCPPSRNATCND